jgi:DNA-binding NarL/FixJ family response regulator
MTRGISSQFVAGADDWPLIGRGRELAALTAACRDAGRRGAVLVGDAGVGKSRLARETLAAAQADGFHAIWIQASRSAASVPLGALHELVPDSARSDDVVALMRRCAERLREGAGGRRVVLGVDDAQLLDPVSATVVLHLASTGAAFVLATVRSGEACPDAIVALWKDQAAPRVELTELGDDDALALIEAILGDPVELAAAQWLIDASRGNALYLRELARGAVESGALRRAQGLWTLVGRPQANAPLIELVSARLVDLDASERAAVELLALGEPLSAREILGLVSNDAVLSGEASGLLVEGHDGVRLAHPLYGEAVRASLPPLRARVLRMRLVDVFEARRPFGPDEALRVARLRLDAGAALPGELTLEAARAANRAGDPELGGQLAELALADGGGLAAAMVLAQAQQHRARPADAEATLAAAEELAPGHAAVTAYARQRLGLLFWELRAPAEVTALLERMADWSDDEFWRGFVRRLSVSYGGMVEGLGDIDAARRMAGDEGLAEEPRRLGAIMHRLGLVISGDGDVAADSAFADLPTLPLRTGTDVAALAALVFVAIETGQRWGELDDYLGRVVRDAVRHRMRDAAGVAACGMARLHLVRGRYRDAARWLAEAEIQLLRHDPFGTMVLVRCTAVGIACFTGDFDGTLAAHERLEAWIAQRSPIAAQRVAVARAAAWAKWVRSPAAAGQGLLDDADVFSGGLPGLAPALAYDALRSGHPGAPAVLASLAERCRSRIVGAFAAHAAARAAHDGAALLLAADEMAAIGALRYAVETSSEAASVFVGQGRNDSARRAAARSRELHAPHQGASLPIIDGLDATAVELTPRQAQLVELARQGLSNAEIADRLVISIRTVETHLYRGMQKLGVSDRHDL